MSDKITVTTEKDGKIIVFEGSGTLTLIERAGGWAETRPTSMSRKVRGVEIVWDGDYTIREADRQPDTLDELADLRKELADLRRENRRLERILQDPLLLKGLEAAWENAEQAPKCRKGDVLIVPGGWGGYTIWEAKRDSQLRAARILSRAPQREPWEDLADVLSEWFGSNQTSQISMERFLYERGVRVTGGEES